MPDKTLIVIAGPTAVGKTYVGIELAKQFNTEIISCDSRQIYKELNIGTAIPSEELLKEVKHHFIQSKSIHAYYNASMYESETMELLDILFKNHTIVLMVGGSGLYIDAVCKGIDDLPDIDKEIRQQLADRMEKEGIESLRLELKRLDPEYYQQVDLRNYKRILKALEITLMTGKPYSAFLTNTHKKRPFHTIKIGLNMKREELYQRINHRVDVMIESGLVDEARALRAYSHLNALNTVGYKEIFRYFNKDISLEEAIDLIKRDTRKYARRQLTWFRKYKDMEWFDPKDIEEIFAFVNANVSNA